MSPTFADLGVPAHLCALLERRGIAEPFPIQTATLPDALAGRDVCGRAPTGSGKTLAFGLAVAVRVGPAEPRRPRALVLVPTRELASQVAGEIDALLTPSSGSGHAGGNGGAGADGRDGQLRPEGRDGRPGGRRRKGGRPGRDGRAGRHGAGGAAAPLSVLPIYGGASYGPQRRALSRGVPVVVACPGRLEDLVAQGDIQLDQVDVVVLDEADRMADMGFLPAVRRLLDQTSPQRQTLLFSATLDGEVDAIVRRYQRDPARHDATPPEEEAGDVEHVFWRTDRSGRVALAAELVNRHGRAIVFSRTRRGADRLTRQLSVAGVTAVAIHGDRSQAQRERALSAFARGKASALVATDVAARGIHVDDVGCVVHYDLPDDPKDYIHRSGRTGRAGASGTVVSFVLDEHRRSARALQRTLGLPQELDVPDVITGRSPRAAAGDGHPGERDAGADGRVVAPVGLPDTGSGGSERRSAGRQGPAPSGGGRRRPAGHKRGGPAGGGTASGGGGNGRGRSRRPSAARGRAGSKARSRRSW